MESQVAMSIVFFFLLRLLPAVFAFLLSLFKAVHLYKDELPNLLLGATHLSPFTEVTD